MTKATIVERLLEEKQITAEEAVVLLTEVVERTIPQDNFPWTPIGPGIIPEPNLTDEDLVPYSEICSCNPKNGGSGICGCIMANTLVPRTYQIGGNWTTSGTDLKISKCPNGNGPCYCTGECKNK